jgi:hypothetical protein
VGCAFLDLTLSSPSDGLFSCGMFDIEIVRSDRVVHCVAGGDTG